MKIAIGSDHRGFPLKERLKEMLSSQGHEVVDLGTDSTESADYPDFALPVAEKAASSEVDRGIVICGSGIGVSIAANKVRGARAALVRTVEDARMSRLHNNANVLALSAGSLSDPRLEEILRTWLTTEFEGGRHARRIGKISDYENKH